MMPPVLLMGIIRFTTVVPIRKKCVPYLTPEHIPISSIDIESTKLG